VRNNLQLGKLGEDLAARFLKKQGYKIIERNFSSRYGEIDIVAQERRTLVFIEVKTRYSKEFGLPEESITPWKIKSLKRGIDFYKILHPNSPELLRVDLVGVILSTNGTLESIKLIKNIL
jgi:putative endonuclease